MYLKIDNPDKLKETYNLEMEIESTHSNHVKYDLHDVFTVVRMHKDTNEPETVNIYTDYPSLTTSKVSQINARYANQYHTKIPGITVRQPFGPSMNSTTP